MSGMNSGARMRAVWPFAPLSLVWIGAWLLGGDLSPLDRETMSALYLGADSDQVLPWLIVTELGGWRVLIPLAILAAAYLFLKRRTHDALFLVGVVISVRILVEWQKILFSRARPEDVHLTDVASLSFPSGHAANSLATYLALAIFLFHSRLAVAAAVGLAALIGLSRILLGVHWPSDVIGGWAFALLCALGFARFAPSSGRAE